MKPFYFLFFFLLFSFGGYAETCNCPERFDWLYSELKANSASFQDVLLKERQRLESTTAEFRQKVARETNEEKCFTLLSDWLATLNDTHSKLRKTGTSSAPVTANASAQEIRAKFANTEKILHTEESFKAYLARNKKKLHPLEGIWKDSNYTLGIIRSKTSTRDLAGFIIKADSVYWGPVR